MSRKPTRAAPAGKRASAKAKPAPRKSRPGTAAAAPRPSKANAPPPKAAPKPIASAVHRGVSASGTLARGPEAEALRVGDDLPAHAVGPISRVDLARYCAASGTWNPISLDEPQARASGMPSVVVPGGLALGLASACVALWLRDLGRIRRLGARCVKMIWPGDLLTARARVSDLRPGERHRELDLDVWVENQKGELVLKGQATCETTATVAPRAAEFFGLPVTAGQPPKPPARATPPTPAPAKPAAAPARAVATRPPATRGRR